MQHRVELTTSSGLWVQVPTLVRVRLIKRKVVDDVVDATSAVRLPLDVNSEVEND
jgi:hypothetical protein